MSKWRELGEVPDSEEEGDGFDSQENLSLPVEGEIDVWEFVDSQESQRNRPADQGTGLPASHSTLDSSPLSSALSDQDLPPVSSLMLNRHRPENGPSSELGKHIQPSPEPSLSQLERDPSDRSDNLASAHTSQSQERGHEATQAAVRYERALRPRKPIQEHPYLLENALYSNILKKHGVKPLTAMVEVTAQGRRDAPPDGEFEDMSQESAPGVRLSEDNTTDLDILPGRVEEFTSPPSSPFKRSPLDAPAQNSTPVSSQAGTDISSAPDQELPDLKELMSRPSRPAFKVGASKRDATQPPSTIRKRRRLNVVDSDPMDPAATPWPRPNIRLDSPAMDGSLILEPSRTPTMAPRKEAIDVSSGDDGIEPRLEIPEAQDTFSDGSDVESVVDLVNQMGHRIRGVLPASWLRLDQQSGRDMAQRDAKRQRRYPSPEREIRRGVAQKRQASSGAAAHVLRFDDSSDSDGTGTSRVTKLQSHKQTFLALDPAPRVDMPELTVLDNDDSVVEDDQIDFMLPARPARTRQLKLPDSIRGKRKRESTEKNPTVRHQRARSKHARITSQMQKPRNRSISGKWLSTGDKHRKTLNVGRVRSSSARVPPPPYLSILDTIEPEAPRFLRIAAREANRRRHKGRSSPRNKRIQLATRQDHVDAMSVLRHWRAGLIPQRPSVTAASTVAPESRSAPPLTEGSGNRPAPRPSPKPPLRTTTRKLVRHVTDGGSISYQTLGGSDESHPKPQGSASHGKRQPLSDPTRPALLELEQDSRMTNAAFHAQKRQLDRLFRDRRLKMPRVASTAGPVEDVVAPFGITSPADPPNQLSGRNRFRKRSRPCRVDLQEPQYSHANDPLPSRYSPDPEPARVDGLESRMLGLGPYGTSYTHHFEAFPLDSRVYFHESTLVGGGVIDLCSSNDFCARMAHVRPRASFILDGRSLKWGAFDAQVSSELGVVIDFVAEHIEPASTEESDSADFSKAAAAAMFVLTYVKDSISLSEDERAKSFVTRAHECLHSFNERMKARTEQITRGPDAQREIALKVYDRLLLACLIVLKICRFWPLLMEESFQLEDCLKSMANVMLSILSSLGAISVRKTYEDVGMARCRERGLRGDHVVVHSWVVVMKTMEIARIHRASFWELAQATIAPSQVLSSVDARDFERSWEAMFALLPLTEFNNLGVIVPGQRHDPASDGWVIPQKLLKRVFLLYQQNTRQSPSFNNYCRALVGRCHYLVQQWGWRKSTGVIGVVFDFFGSQNLGHLRNEEVRQSPRFLEELAQHPTLDIEPGDSCFHVFLKLVALSIHKLRAIGAIKDVRNMVARTIPNHNRQHLKEQNVLARDLAALRNHHDLLGTLFWASAPEIRPQANLMERLVAPASSHKEACLINIRCWSQLARFIVASGEAAQSLKPFLQWRNSFFQQVLRQFDSVKSVVHQQVLSLAKDVSKSISDDVVQATISRNKATVGDVLYACAAASLDVMRHTRDLEAASFALNTLQLQSIFKHFAVAPPALDWVVLRAALGTLDSFIERIDQFKVAEESQQSESQILNSAQADDALLFVDQDISRGFFSMARCVLSCPQSQSISVTVNLGRVSCQEQIVTLSARIGARLMDAQAMRLSDMFKAGAKYCLFNGPPHKLGLEERRSLVLFTWALLRNDWDGFSDSGISLSEVWTLALVKPKEYLGYEMQLAQELHRHDKGLVPITVEGLAVQADYSTNRDLFEFAISNMRRQIRDADPSVQKVLAAESSTTLKLAMEQIKGDLATMSRRPSGHEGYVTFVQSIVSLIKTHGSDLCAVDNYFLQISKEYSPSVQDPNLQVAGLISYGLRLREGDGRSSQQLFFLLFNNVKFAIINDKLAAEVVMLRRGMGHPGIVDFVVGKMLPAIVRACFRSSTAFPLLDVYAEALWLVFAKKTAPRELGENDLPLVDALLRACVEGFSDVSHGSAAWGRSELHVMRQTMATLNLLWPSIYAVSVSGTETRAWEALSRSLGHLRDFASTASTYLEQQLHREAAFEPACLCAGLEEVPTEDFRAGVEVRSLTNEIVQDIEKSWVVTERTVSIQTPGMNRRGANQGMQMPAWDTRELLDDLDRRIREWHFWWQRVFGVCSLATQLESVVF